MEFIVNPNMKVLGELKMSEEALPFKEHYTIGAYHLMIDESMGKSNRIKGGQQKGSFALSL
jgi:hypothetical protein